MFGLIMSKLNSVRIGKLVIDGVVKGRRGGSQAEEVRRLETHHHPIWKIYYSTLQPLSEKVGTKNSLSGTTLDGQRLLFERLEQKVSLWEASLDGQRLLGARLDINFLSCKIKLMSVNFL